MFLCVCTFSKMHYLTCTRTLLCILVCFSVCLAACVFASLVCLHTCRSCFSVVWRQRCHGSDWCLLTLPQPGFRWERGMLRFSFCSSSLFLFFYLFILMCVWICVTVRVCVCGFVDERETERDREGDYCSWEFVLDKEWTMRLKQHIREQSKSFRLFLSGWETCAALYCMNLLEHEKM